MKQSVIQVAEVVRDYDEAIEFFCLKLHFLGIEDRFFAREGKEEGVRGNAEPRRRR